MADPEKKEEASLKKSAEQKKKASYVNWWLFRNKGTVAEPWPTAEDLWSDPKVQDAIKNHNNLVQKKNGSYK